MRSLVRAVPVLVVALLMQGAPARGDGGTDMERGAAVQKDECLLVARDCSSDTISARVDRLEREIAKGSAVYSETELNKMRRDLQEAERIQQIYNNHFPPVAI